MHLSVVYTHIPVNPPYSGSIPLVNHQQSFSYGAFIMLIVVYSSWC